MTDSSKVRGVEIQALVWMGRALNTASIFGPDHFKSREAATAAFQAVSSLMKAAPSLAIGIGGDRLLSNGQPVDTRDQPILRMLESRLITLKTRGFTLRRGLREEDLLQLLTRLATARAGEWDDQLRESPIPHVLGESGIWQAVPEGASIGPARRGQDGDAKPSRSDGVLRLGPDAVGGAPDDMASEWELDRVAREWVEALQIVECSARRIEKAIAERGVEIVARALKRAGAPEGAIRRWLER